VIGGGELNIDPTKMEAILKWSTPTTVTEVRGFVGASQHFLKFIASLLVVVSPLHTITLSGKSFQWRKNYHMAFDELNKMINQAPIIALPNLQKPFKVEIVASGYAIIEVLMQGVRLA
jgi:hypothetical protein